VTNFYHVSALLSLISRHLSVTLCGIIDSRNCQCNVLLTHGSSAISESLVNFMKGSVFVCSCFSVLPFLMYFDAMDSCFIRSFGISFRDFLYCELISAASAWNCLPSVVHDSEKLLTFHIALLSQYSCFRAIFDRNTFTDYLPSEYFVTL